MRTQTNKPGRLADSKSHTNRNQLHDYVNTRLGCRSCDVYFFNYRVGAGSFVIFRQPLRSNIAWRCANSTNPQSRCVLLAPSLTFGWRCASSKAPRLSTTVLPGTTNCVTPTEEATCMEKRKAAVREARLTKVVVPQRPLHGCIRRRRQKKRGAQKF